MGVFNFNHFNNKFYIFENDEDAENFYACEKFTKSKFFKDQQVFDNIGFVELVASGGYYEGGSLDYISLLDYFDYNNEIKDKKEYFHEFLEDMLKEIIFKNIHRYTKKDIIYKFLDLIVEYEGINLNINLKNYKLNKIKWKRTKKDLKDFIIKVFDEMIEQDLKKAKERLKNMAESYGAIYIKRTSGWTYERIN